MKILTQLSCPRFYIFFTLFLFSVLFPAQTVSAQTVTLTSSNEFVFDSNKSCLPDFEGPHASYVSYEICNTTGSVTAPLTATFAITGTGYSLSGGQAASQFVGTLGIGECASFFWLIEYPCTAQTAVIDVTVTDDTATVFGTSADNMITSSGISANATGILGTQSINSASVGQLSIYDVVYTFGTTAAGGDLSFQPVGNIDFDASCFQLIGLEIISSPDFSCINVGDRDQMYYQIPTGCNVTGSGNTVQARYYFKSNCAGASTTTQPYAYGSSGGQLKYTGNFEDPTSITTFPVTTPPSLIISKTVDPINILTVPNTATYTIAIENTSASPYSLDRITDILPAPFTFNSIDVTSDITAAVSSTVPAITDTGTLSFVGGIDAPTYPYTEYYIPGNTTVNLVYTVDIPGTTANGNYLNSATYSIGTYNSASVSADLLIGPPPCEITVISTSNLSSCNDNGTNANPADDFFTADVTVTFANAPTTGTLDLTGDGTATVSVAGLTSPHIFTAVQMTADGGAIDLTATFSADGTCTFNETNAGTAPASCSPPLCSVTAIGTSNLSVCNDNGTPSNSADDFFTADVTVTFANAPASGTLDLTGDGTATVSVTGLTSPHIFTAVQMTADGGAIDLTATFSADGTCTFNETNAGTAPASCSVPPCSVTAIGTSNLSVCNDNGTPSNSADDFFTADVTVTFANAPASGTLDLTGDGTATVSVTGLTSPHIFTAVQMTADGGAIDLTATFSADGTCTFNETNAGTAPASCSVPPCSVTAIGTSNLSVCNDNGTPSNSADDFFTADVTVTFANAPASGTLDLTGDGTATVSVTGLTSPHIFTAVQMTADGGAIDLTATFSADGTCTFNETNAGTAPASCSVPPCSVTAIGTSNLSVCNDNGTPSNSADDFFTADVTVTFANAPASGTLDLTGDGTATVSVTGLTSPHIFTAVQMTADGGAIDLTATFSADGTCTFNETNTGTAPASCSVPPCSVTAIGTSNLSVCNDNGTPSNSADDFFTADVTVTFANAPTTGTLDLTGDGTATVSVTGLTSPHIFTAVQMTADGGAIDLTATFSADGTCTFNETNAGTAPASCSVPPCSVTAIGTSNLSVCNDNGTPSNSADDFFTADVTVTFANAPTTGTLDLTGDGTATVSVAGLTSPHIFTAVQMTADGGAIDLTATFSADGTCNFNETNAGTAPTECSDCAPIGSNSTDTDGDGLTDCEETTGIDDPGTPAVPSGTSDSSDPCDPIQLSGYMGYDSTNPIWQAADCDGDGVTNGQEIIDGTNPLDPCDYLIASQDPTTTTTTWNDLDCDGDGVTNGQEIIDGTNPQDPCDYLIASQDPTTTTTTWNDLDCDGDGVTNGQEIIDGTNPLDPCDYLIASQDPTTTTTTWNDLDCDGDGVTNGQEIIDGTNPQDPCDYLIASQDPTTTTTTWNDLDCDGDGVTNGQEIIDGTNPQDPCDYLIASQDPTTTTTTWNDLDCDGDGVTNGQEIIDGTNPQDPCDYLIASQDPTTTTTTWNDLDCDGDGVTNGQEIIDGTNPQDPCDYLIASQDPTTTTTTWNDLDCDGDGVTNGQEIIDGTNPLDPCDYLIASQDPTTTTTTWNDLDCDGDGVTNGQEIIDGTNPQDPCDYLIASQDPTTTTTTWNDLDCDGDGVTNGQEIIDGTNPQDPCDYLIASQDPTTTTTTWNDLDCDGDGVTNGQEIIDGTNPQDPCDYLIASQDPTTTTTTWNDLDCDGDGVTNGQEIIDGTNPQDPCDYLIASQDPTTTTTTWNDLDCDGDGVTNGQEIIDGTNPQDPCDYLIASQDPTTTINNLE